MVEPTDPHDAVQSFFERVAPSPDALIDALDTATKGIWSAACEWLDPTLVAAVAQRALAHAGEKFPPLSALTILPATGVDTRPLREHASMLRAADLRTGAAFLVDELATVLADCSGQLLAGALARALGSDEAPHAPRVDDGGAARRLRCVFAATRALAGCESVEAGVGAVIAAIDDALPLRTAALVLARRDRPRLIVWHAPSAVANDAESQAMVAYAYLAGASPSDLPGLEIVRAPIAARVASPAPSAASARAAGPTHDIALPLVSARGAVFGLLRLEAVGAFGLEDLELASALAVQLAGALEHCEVARAAGTEAAADAGAHGQRELLSVISHDLRNPLSAILMSVVLLLRRQAAAVAATGTGGDQVRQLEVIKRSAERMNYLIQNLVDAVSLEAGQMLIDPQTTDLAPIVDDSIRLLTSVAGSKSVKIESHIALGTAAPIDRERMLQTISNLLNACIRFSGKGGTIVVSAVRSSERDELDVGVADNGPGIAADEAAHVFDRHWWAQRSSGLSTGLGLSVARGIVEAHGGRITLTSSPGTGTAFRFSLPLVRVATATEPKSAVAGPVPT